MEFLNSIKDIKKDKKIPVLLGAGLILIIVLLLPAGERRGPELPPGFERTDIVPTLPSAPVPAEERVSLPPQLLEEARRRQAQGWGTDPFFPVAAEAVYVRLRLEAIFLGAEKSAIINGEVLTIGDKINGYRVTDIAEGVVTLGKKDLTRRLSFW